MTPKDKKLLEEFGFVDKNGLADNKQLKKALKSSPSARSQKYDYKWRLKLKKPYFSYSTIKTNIEKYYTEYEDYLINNSGGNPVTTAEMSKQIGYLTDNRGNPWEIKPHRGKIIWYIKDPNRNFWFRALNNRQLLQAIRIIRTQYSSRFPPTKPKLPGKGTYKLRLNYKKCEQKYNSIKNKGTRYQRAQNLIAILICLNISKTWNTQKGDWKPWNHSWFKLAHDKPYFQINKFRLRHGINTNLSETVKYWNDLAGKDSKSNRNVEFRDVKNFVNRWSSYGNAKGAYIAAVAFTVGGETAAKIITSFCRDNNIPLHKIRR